MLLLSSLLLLGLVVGLGGVELPAGAPEHEVWIQEFGHDTFQYPG